MIIDSHQHFWTLSRGDYDWLTPELESIYRDFLPSDLSPLLAKSGVDGTIVVQATETVQETEYLLNLADQTDWILGVVGWVDMEKTNAPETIREFSHHPKFVGIRPMLQSIEDDEWMLKPSLAPAIETLIDQQLSFDALVLPRHLQPLQKFLMRYDGLNVIIDHGAKPDIKNKAWRPWANDIAAIAEFSHVYCKMSGLVTEASSDWTVEDVEPYAKHILSTFGPRRTVFGSDWPVLNLAGDYDNWFKTAASWVSKKDLSDVFGQNAKRFYLNNG